MYEYETWQDTNMIEDVEMTAEELRYWEEHFANEMWVERQDNDNIVEEDDDILSY